MHLFALTPIFALTHLGYLIAGWSITFAVISLYAYFVLRRARNLTGKVPESRRRWMTSSDD